MENLSMTKPERALVQKSSSVVGMPCLVEPGSPLLLSKSRAFHNHVSNESSWKGKGQKHPKRRYKQIMYITLNHNINIKPLLSV